MAKKWIGDAIKHPGALHRELGVPEGKTIPKRQLEKAASKGGTIGRRARLAETLEGFHHHEGKAMKHEHECKGKHCKHPSHGKHHEHEKAAFHGKGKHHHRHGEHHEPEARGKHKTGRGMTGEGSPRYERDMDKESRASTPIKVPASAPWPHDEYKGRGHHTVSERSNGMLSRHDAGRHIKVRK